KHLAASTRLSPVARSAAPPPPPPPPPPSSDAPAYASPDAFADESYGLGVARAEAGKVAFEQPAPPPPAPARSGPDELPRGMSDFAANWLFGNQSTEGLTSMAEAEKMPEPTKEERVARFIARGGLERSRGARIVEGSGTGPISAEELGVDPAPET